MARAARAAAAPAAATAAPATPAAPWAAGRTPRRRSASACSRSASLAPFVAARPAPGAELPGARPAVWTRAGTLSTPSAMDSSAPIFGFNSARADIVRTVIERVMEGTKDSLLTLNDAAYHETKRLEGARRPAAQKELAEWQRLARPIARMSDGERRARLHHL